MNGDTIRERHCNYANRSNQRVLGSIDKEVVWQPVHTELCAYTMNMELFSSFITGRITRKRLKAKRVTVKEDKLIGLYALEYLIGAGSIPVPSTHLNPTTMNQEFKVEIELSPTQLQTKLNQWRHDNVVIIHSTHFHPNNTVNAVIELRKKEVFPTFVPNTTDPIEDKDLPWNK